MWSWTKIENILLLTIFNAVCLIVAVMFLVIPSCIKESVKIDKMVGESSSYSSTEMNGVGDSYIIKSRNMELENVTFENNWASDLGFYKLNELKNFIIGYSDTKNEKIQSFITQEICDYFCFDWNSVKNVDYFPEDEFDGDFACGKPITGIMYNMSRVVGGQETVKYSWPWLIRTVSTPYSWWQCGGVLVSPVHSLTAAHCLGIHAPERVVIIGSHVFNDGTKIPVYIVRYHPMYKRSNLQYDCAILTHQKITYSEKVFPACIATRAVPCNTTYLWTAGYGRLESGGSVAKVATQVKISIQDCPYTSLPKQVILCAGDDGKGSCQGDSGGPLGRYTDGKWNIHGLVSFGVGCGWPGKPAAYARIDVMLNWLCCYLKNLKECENIECNISGEWAYPPYSPGNREVLQEDIPDCYEPPPPTDPPLIVTNASAPGDMNNTVANGNSTANITGGSAEASGNLTSNVSNVADATNSTCIIVNATDGNATATATYGNLTSTSNMTDGCSVINDTSTSVATNTSSNATEIITAIANDDPWEDFKNELGVCIGEPVDIHTGWNRDGTRNFNQKITINIYYLSYNPLIYSKKHSRLATENPYYRVDIENEVGRTGVECPCGQMNQPYFDFLKENHVEEYFQLQLRRIHKTQSVNLKVCDVL